jgi:hypothetical protein
VRGLLFFQDQVKNTGKQRPRKRYSQSSPLPRKVEKTVGYQYVIEEDVRGLGAFPIVIQMRKELFLMFTGQAFIHHL